MKYLIPLFLILISSVSAYNYHGCALAPDNLHGWVVCLDTVMILYTTDGGATWQPQDPPDSTTKRFFDVTCIDQLSAWTCGILGEILHTDNGGIDWYAQAIGLSKYATRIEFIDQDYGWAACGDGTIGRTTNGGNFWDQNFTPWYSAEYYGVSFLNQWDGWAVAGYPDSLSLGQGMIIHSSDGGINWDSLYQTSGYEDYLDVHFFNLFDGIVVGGDETDTSAVILKTTDGGATWNNITPPTNTYYLRAVDFVGNHGWAVGRFGTIIYTNDSGDSWVFQNNPATTTLFDVDFSDSLHGIACGYNIILYTTDGGQNWNATSVVEKNSTACLNKEFIIFPTPASDRLKVIYNTAVSVQDIEVHIYDTAGRELYGFVKHLNRYPDRIEWKIEFNLAGGIYFLELREQDRSLIRKFTVLR